MTKRKPQTKVVLKEDEVIVESNECGVCGKAIHEQERYCNDHKER